MSERRSGTRHRGSIRAVLLWGLLMPVSGCRKAEVGEPEVKLPPGMVLRDRTFHSEALGRDVTYRMIAPSSIAPGERICVVYLLHGNGGNLREWSEASHFAELAGKGYLLVMPEGRSSFYMNSAGEPSERYEDFLTRDLPADAEGSLPAPVDRVDRAIVGNSMGGYGAIVLSLKHPGFYGFAGALSPAVDVTERGFKLRRPTQSMALRKIFGPPGSAMRERNDPFVLAKAADPRHMPFLFVSVGEQEPLLKPVLRFAALLRALNLPHQFRTQLGGHNWVQWNGELPALISALKASRGWGA